jgi:hypothetical protein
MSTDQHNEISATIAGLRSRLDTLASITAENILIPGGPQEHYHAIIEEAYAALGFIETQLDELRTELEWQHKRLDEIRNAQLASASQKMELGVDAEEAGRRAHEDWANDEWLLVKSTETSSLKTLRRWGIQTGKPSCQPRNHFLH